MTPEERRSFRTILEGWNPKLIHVKNISVIFKPKFKTVSQPSNSVGTKPKNDQPILKNMLASQNFNPKIPHHLQERFYYRCKQKYTGFFVDFNIYEFINSGPVRK